MKDGAGVGGVHTGLFDLVAVGRVQEHGGQSVAGGDGFGHDAAPVAGRDADGSKAGSEGGEPLI